MTHIQSVVLETPDPAAADAFHRAAFGIGSLVQVREGEAPAPGFRGFTLSLVVAQPGTVDLLIAAALGAGATAIKPAAKSLWGYGGVVAAPDGTIWKVATSAKKDKGPVTREIDDVVLLLGASDVKAAKRFYAERGMTVKRSFGGKYAEFDAPAGAVKLALYGRRALAKDAGVPAEPAAAPGIVLTSAAGAFTDPDGFTWEPAAVRQPA